MVEFQVRGLDELRGTFSQIQKYYPKLIDKFLKSEGNKLKRRTVTTAKSSVRKKTGNYFAGIKRGQHYKYRGIVDSIRVYAGKPAYHAHLIEYGHQLKHGGRTRAFEVFSRAGDNFESTFDKDVDKFIDTIIDFAE